MPQAGRAAASRPADRSGANARQPAAAKAATPVAGVSIEARVGPEGALIASGVAQLHQFDEPPFRPGAAVDVGLGLLDRAMTGELLHIAQAAAGF
jgi:hypothetical protein